MDKTTLNQVASIKLWAEQIAEHARRVLDGERSDAKDVCGFAGLYCNHILETVKAMEETKEN